MELIWFLVTLILVAILISILWSVFGVGELFARLSPTQRLLVALLGLLIIIAVIVYFFGHLVPLPR